MFREIEVLLNFSIKFRPVNILDYTLLKVCNRSVGKTSLFLEVGITHRISSKCPVLCTELEIILVEFYVIFLVCLSACQDNTVQVFMKTSFGINRVMVRFLSTS